MRKSGFFPRLALVNLVRNGRFYGPYLLSCGMTAAMYYILSYLTRSDIVASVRGAGYLQSLMYLGALVVALFAAVLLLYANSFVMKRRRRELGLYNILGLEKRHIAHLMVWETVYCAAAAILGGLAAGVLLSKLVLLLLLQVSRLPVQYGFEISLPGMANTAALFGILFLLTLVWNLAGLLRSKPVELLHSASAGEREPRTKRLLVVLGAVTLGAGYATALTVADPFTALAYFFLAVVLVMIGTYCLFTAGSIALLKHLRNSPRYYYQPKHFTAVAGLLYRMKQNAVGLANICILSTMVLVTVSTTVSLYVGLEGSLDRMYPHDIDVVQQLEGVSPEQEAALNEDTLERVQTAAAEAGRKVELLQWSTLLDTVGWYTGNTFTLTAQEGVSTEIQILTADDYGRLTGRTVALGPGQVLVQAENIDLPATFYIEDLPFHVAGTITDFPRYNNSILISGQAVQLSLVVADETVVSAINVRDTSDHREFHVQMDLDGTEAEKQAFVDPLLAADVNGVYSVISRQDNAMDLYTMYGGFLFLGVFLGLLFLLSTVLIIYYKQISEGYEDQRRYQIMQQVGMSPREVRSSIRSQVLLVFFLPLVTAGIHVAAAFPMLCKLLELFNLFDVRLFALCAAGTLLVFCAIYALVYGLTTRTYSRIVGIRN
ncbi:FtsX-like permease family protein [Oscillibacter valericigenes]|uniref:FtsX-like permease family protein n=1 Tax=Oscillibacter valericigenes TaxID=351091 RepID=UPI00195AA513|nr:FtsX-like permease family protein [Oscillibacter valericigenes]MBM6909914.1 FtsX-like permease family protein [Oscillibacter valericigenes]